MSLPLDDSHGLHVENRRGDWIGRLDGLFAGEYEALLTAAGRIVRARLTRRSPRCEDLVHEAYVRMRRCRPMRIRSRDHFLRIAARLMRFRLVDGVRTRCSIKRGGGRAPLPLEAAITERAPSGCDRGELLDLLEALSSLEARDGIKASVLELRFVRGWSVAETAESLGISPSTVQRLSDGALYWLRREMRRLA